VVNAAKGVESVSNALSFVFAKGISLDSLSNKLRSVSANGVEPSSKAAVVVTMFESFDSKVAPIREGVGILRRGLLEIGLTGGS
jgi:hypothetical protein